MKETPPYILILCFMCFFYSAANTADSFETWVSREIKVRFTYPSYWRISPPIQDATVVTINWIGKESGGLVASCSLQTNKSSVGNLSKNEIHQNFETILHSLLRNTSKRASFAELVQSKKSFQDGHPVIYLEMETEISFFDKELKMKIYSLVTAWNNEELLFSCGVPSELLNEERGLKQVIEGNVYRIIRSLQFDR